jgi:hypothetical protein
MSEPTDAVEPTPETLRALGTMCLSVYLSTAPNDELFAAACRAAATRSRSLLRAYLQEGTTQLRRPIGPEDRSLFAVYAAVGLGADTARGHGQWPAGAQHRRVAGHDRKAMRAWLSRQVQALSPRPRRCHKPRRRAGAGRADRS